MSEVRVDFTLIQPLVYSLETWLALRKAMPRALRDGAVDGAGAEDARLHLHGLSDPLFDTRLSGVDSIIDAFPTLLEQTREMPCVVFSLERPSAGVLEHPDEWPEGVTLDASATRFVVPGSGEPVLLHLASGTVDSAALSGRFLQAELRELHLGRSPATPSSSSRPSRTASSG